MEESLDRFHNMDQAGMADRGDGIQQWLGLHSDILAVTEKLVIAVEQNEADLVDFLLVERERLLKIEEISRRECSPLLADSWSQQEIETRVLPVLQSIEEQEREFIDRLQSKKKDIVLQLQKLQDQKALDIYLTQE